MRRVRIVTVFAILAVLSASALAGGRVRGLRPAPKVRHTARTARSSAALSPDGPLGAYGPLGRLGPIGGGAWNPRHWMRMIGEWSRVSAVLARAGGALSDRGPLGQHGPVGRARAQFPRPLRAGEALAVVGPDGPLGALGGLGPLGPVGAHGFAVDADGRYRQGGRVRRSVNVPAGDGTSRRFDLFEIYPADVAAAMRDNDTSFMAVGSHQARAQSTTFPFRSREGGFVQVVVTPEARLDTFALDILDARGNVLATSDERGTVNFATIEVAPGARLQARVTLLSTGHFLRDHPYRLSVVGTAEAP